MTEAFVMDGICIARADDAILPACFALLPSLASPDAVLFCARAADGRLLGAGGLLWRAWNAPAGMPAWIEVLPDSRRRGVGRALLTAMARFAGAETDRLWAIDTLPEGDVPATTAGPTAGAAFARAVGAVAGQRQLHFEITDIGFLHQMTAIATRLRARGHVPADTVVRMLAPGDADAVKWLVAEGLATPPPHLDAMLADAMTADPATATVDRERSVVVTAGDGTLAGVLLSRRVPEAGASEILCNVVSPDRRRGFANALLLERFSQVATDAGCYRIRFDCDEGIRDSIGLARRGSADHVRTMTRFAYAASAAARD
jgi:GNAT superfamily N-acetyltransferase